MKFYPSRFLQEELPSPFTFVSFISGPQNDCSGQHLALLESKMVFSMFLQSYKINEVMQSEQSRWGKSSTVSLQNARVSTRRAHGRSRHSGLLKIMVLLWVLFISCCCKDDWMVKEIDSSHLSFYTHFDDASSCLACMARLAPIARPTLLRLGRCNISMT